MKNKLLILGIIFSVMLGNIKLKAQGSQPLLGQVLYVAFNFAPRGWEPCNGQLLTISDNYALFNLLGTTYGGDGQTTFALPNIQSRVLIGAGTSTADGMTYQLGQAGGEESHTLTTLEMPMHNHKVSAVSSVGNKNIPTNNLLADSQILDKKYSTTAGGAMAPMSNLSVKPAGGSQPHNNIQPYVTFKCIIAVEGIYPSSN